MKLKFIMILTIIHIYLFAKPIALIVTDYENKPIFFKSMHDISKKINNYKIIWFNLEYKKLYDDNYVKEKRKELKLLIQKNKKNLALIRAVNTSFALSKIVDLFPANIPTIVDSSSPEVISHYKGNKIFSIVARIKWTRGNSILKILKLKKLKGVVFIKKNDKIQPYSELILNFLKTKVPVIVTYSNKLNNDFFKKYKNYLFIFYIDSSSKTKQMYLNLKKNIYNLNFFSVYSSDLRFKQSIKDYFFYDSTSVSKNKNVFFYPYLGKKILDKCNFDTHCINDYSRVWNKYYPTISLLNFPNQSNLNINQLRKLIFKKLESLTNQYAIENYTQNIRHFEKTKYKNKNIYFADIYKDHVEERYLYYIYKKNHRLLYPIQPIDNKKIPVAYITTYLNKIKILDLSATKAKVSLIVNIKSLKNVTLGDEIAFNSDEDYYDSVEVDLLKSNKKNGFYNKTYFVEYVVSMHNDLFNFPYDKNVINIEYVINNYDKNPFILQTLHPKKYLTNNISKNWIIINTFATYYQKFFPTLEEPFSIYRQFFTIIVKRKKPMQIIIKYILPAVIILILGLYVIYLILKGYMEAEIDLITDALISIISIFFVYSLLVAISNLIMLDIVFFVMIFVLVAFIIKILFKIKKENNK